MRDHRPLATKYAPGNPVHRCIYASVRKIRGRSILVIFLYFIWNILWPNYKIDYLANFCIFYLELFISNFSLEWEIIKLFSILNFLIRFYFLF
jgi:hypothetical protein